MEKDGNNKSFVKHLLSIFITRSETSVIAATILLCVIFSTRSSFLSAYNIFNVSRTASLYIMIAIGQAMVIIVSGMNVSLGAIGGLSVICLGYMVQTWHMNEVVAVLIARDRNPARRHKRFSYNEI
jgi:ribose transport system permease protein